MADIEEMLEETRALAAELRASKAVAVTFESRLDKLERTVQGMQNWLIKAGEYEARAGRRLP